MTFKKHITWKKAAEYGLVSADGRFKAFPTFRRSYPFRCFDTLTGRAEGFTFMWEAKNYAELILWAEAKKRGESVD